jgi:hypothetical protein
MLLTLIGSGATARADGQVTMRGAYYKERSTRVTQPMTDALFSVGDDGELRAHALVDSITSASPGAGAAGVAFTERRYEGGASYLHTLGRFRFGAAGRYSNEPDYKSMFGTVRGQAELAKRNFTVGVAFGGGIDDISNAGAQGGLGEPVTGTLRTTLGSLSVSQILSQLVLATATYDISYLEGFQENPYRTVVAGGSLEPERVPETRLRHALYAQVRGFVPSTKSTVITGYRLYFDDWGITAHTPEVKLIQELATDMDLHVRFRYHRQSKAEFFKTIYNSSDPMVEPYLTDDVKLGNYSTQAYGLKLDSTLEALGFQGSWSNVRADLSFEYVVQHNRFGNAVVGQLAFTVPFEY